MWVRVRVVNVLGIGSWTGIEAGSLSVRGGGVGRGGEGQSFSGGEARLAARGLAEHGAARAAQHDRRRVREDLPGEGDGEWDRVRG